MNIIKIVVDELPDECVECKFQKVRPINLGIATYCLLNGKMTHKINKRPAWCPLVVEDEVTFEEFCKWKRSKNPDWYWQTECLDWFDDIPREYCSCGKRIKYVEVE